MAGENQAIQTSRARIQIQKSQLNEKRPSGLRIRLEENSLVNDLNWLANRSSVPNIFEVIIFNPVRVYSLIAGGRKGNDEINSCFIIIGVAQI